MVRKVNKKLSFEQVYFTLIKKGANGMGMIDYEVKNRIAFITLNRPERFNAYGKSFFNEMPETWKSLGMIKTLWLPLSRELKKRRSVLVMISRAENFLWMNLRNHL